MLSRIGSDIAGKKLLDDLMAEGVNTDYVIQTEERTGQVYIPIFEDNYKYMIMDIQVNNPLSIREVNVDLLAESYSFAIFFDLQKELSLEILRSFIIRRKKTCVVLCAASNISHSDFTSYGYPDFIIANQEEAKFIPMDLLQPHTNIIVTRGEKGVICYSTNGDITELDGVSVEVCDTIGAGDCFSGLFCRFISDGTPLADALSIANYGAALSTRKSGARNGLPYQADLISKRNYN